MTAPYDIQTYLLDRANVHDTVTKNTLYYDIGSFEGLIKEVYAPQVVIDYTSLLGGQPVETTNSEWAKSLEPMMSSYDGTQHVVTGLLIELPQPVKGATRPDKCTVVANVNAHLYRKEAKGGPIMHNGGRYKLDLVRLPELEEKGENPWRVSKQVTTASWLDGNFDVMAPVAGLGH
ncbi:hypothetical protein F5B20DRAFT_561532 [Whalleya microplaca]|nr:hypothetical protein F5B20DRAFT_561532 [Whalleya microplaca]